MSEEFKSIVDSSYDVGTPIWIYTDDYIYGMIPTEGDRWKEVSYTFADPNEPLHVSERGANLSYQFLLEELEKGVSFYVKDFDVNAVKAFEEQIQGKSDSEKIQAVIDEIINNTEKYTEHTDFLIQSKDELGKLKEKV